MARATTSAPASPGHAPLPVWLAAGAAAGAAATLAMTAAMMALHRALPRTERQPLPPRQIALRVADAIGLRRKMNEPARTGATLAAHFGFGTAMGAAYAPIASAIPGLPARGAAGVFFALLVWLVSYAGWLPALSLYPPPQDEPAGRNAVMIAAHVTWGAAVGLLIAPLARTLAARRGS